MLDFFYRVQLRSLLFQINWRHVIFEALFGTIDIFLVVNTLIIVLHLPFNTLLFFTNIKRYIVGGCQLKLSRKFVIKWCALVSPRLVIHNLVLASGDVDVFIELVRSLRDHETVIECCLLLTVFILLLHFMCISVFDYRGTMDCVGWLLQDWEVFDKSDLVVHLHLFWK